MRNKVIVINNGLKKLSTFQFLGHGFFFFKPSNCLDHRIHRQSCEWWTNLFFFYHKKRQNKRIPHKNQKIIIKKKILQKKSKKILFFTRLQVANECGFPLWVCLGICGDITPKTKADHPHVRQCFPCFFSKTHYSKIMKPKQKEITEKNNLTENLNGKIAIQAYILIFVVLTKQNTMKKILVDALNKTTIRIPRNNVEIKKISLQTIHPHDSTHPYKTTHTISMTNLFFGNY